MPVKGKKKPLALLRFLTHLKLKYWDKSWNFEPIKTKYDKSKNVEIIQSKLWGKKSKLWDESIQKLKDEVKVIRKIQFF